MTEPAIFSFGVVQHPDTLRWHLWVEDEGTITTISVYATGEEAAQCGTALLAAFDDDPAKGQALFRKLHARSPFPTTPLPPDVCAGIVRDIVRRTQQVGRVKAA